PGTAHLALVPDPEGVATRRWVTLSDAEIAVERPGGLVPKRAHPRAAAFPDDRRDILIQVYVVQLQVRTLRKAHPRVMEEPKDRGVAAIHERPTLDGLEQPL